MGKNYHFFIFRYTFIELLFVPSYQKLHPTYIKMIFRFTIPEEKVLHFWGQCRTRVLCSVWKIENAIKPGKEPAAGLSPHRRTRQRKRTNHLRIPSCNLRFLPRAVAAKGLSNILPRYQADVTGLEILSASMSKMYVYKTNRETGCLRDEWFCVFLL